MRFNKLDLNQLVVLDALFSTRSVGLAAKQLFLSQPATSCALGRLREYFKDELLVPAGKTYVLTPLATELLKPVREVLLQIQTITETSPSFDPTTSTRRFTIESSDYVISIFLSKVVQQAEKLAPLMEFDLRVISPQSQEHLDEGNVDLLIAPEFSVHGHPSEPLFEDTFSCIMCIDHPIKDATISLDQYFELSHVGVEWGGGQRVTFDARIISIGKRSRRQDVIAPSFMLVPELVINSLRIATLPTRLAQQIARRFPIRVLPCPLDLPTFVEQVQWHKHRETDPAVVWLRTLMRETTRSLPAIKT
ncbi:MAG: LysR family transcriptional regulator [Pseudomonadota bacterium]